MLPPSLVSVYQQYKEDTNAVASWLASTAKSRGYPADLLSGSSPQATVPEHSKRLKGKARKQAKAATQQPKDSSSNSSNPDYIIAIKDFVPLAEFVAAAKKPVVSVPLSFAKTLNRVISTRSGFRTRLAESSDSPDLSADSTHSYFVGVLENVREVLTPRFSPATRDAAKPPSPADPVGEVGGRFAGLSVDEPSEEFINAPDIERPVPVKDDKATYVAEPLKEFVEALFAYSLMIKDLAMIRARIEWIWITYRDNGLELVAAAIATNTACDLARNLMGEMEPMFKAHGGAIEIAHKFYLVQCIAEGFSRDDIQDFENGSNYETYEIATDTYIVAFKMLKTVLGALDLRGAPILNDGSLGTYDPSRDWSKMSNQEKCQQDMIMMGEIFTEIAIVVRYFPSYPVYDEFIRGMQELDRTRQIPMYLAFAAQILLDLHHILRGALYSAQERCMSHLGPMAEDLALQEDFHMNLRTKKSVAHNIQVIKDFRENIKWVQDDHIGQARVASSRKLNGPCIPPTHRLLKYSPVVSGLMLYRYRALMYEISLAWVNERRSILSSMHLCNALKQEGLLSPHETRGDSWDDLVAVMTILGKDSFYVGSELPKNPENYFKKLCLQMGMTASAFSNSKDRRIATPARQISKDLARCIKDDCAPVSQLFLDRYVRNTGQVDWTPEHVDSVLSRSLHLEDVLKDDSSFILNMTSDAEKLRERKRKNALDASGKKETVARMPPEHLIRSLTLVLHMESLTMAFPYLTLHRSLWGVLLEVRNACESWVAESYGPHFIDKEDNLPSVVTCIFMSLVKGDDRLFIRAGEVVRDQLRQGQGVKALQRLKLMGFTVLEKRAATSTLSKTATFYIL